MVMVSILSYSRRGTQAGYGQMNLALTIDSQLLIDEKKPIEN